ncbi:MAG: PadR family transcriptional regulator [Fimbriimonadaceae bacterium]|nr:PadR family transcriptional regulator [Fimbriimonadaceae bacterium]
MIANGVTSGYAMRKFMGRMRGSQWSTESGSIYRALRRLGTAGLVRESGRAGSPNRQRTEYELTPDGKTEVSAWLSSTPLYDDFAALHDPIRARTQFLGLIERESRAVVVKSWVASSKSFVEGLKREVRTPADSEDFEHLSLLNLIELAEARHNWLRQLYAQLK